MLIAKNGHLSCITYARPAPALLSNFIQPATASNCLSLHRSNVRLASVAIVPRRVGEIHKWSQWIKASKRKIRSPQRRWILHSRMSSLLGWVNLTLCGGRSIQKETKVYNCFHYKVGKTVIFIQAAKADISVETCIGPVDQDRNMHYSAKLNVPENVTVPSARAKIQTSSY